MYIHLDLAFLEHRKLKRLTRALGAQTDTPQAVLRHVAASALMTMWTNAVTQCADGDFTGWLKEDIADLCRWPEEVCPGAAFVDALASTGWLDELDGNLSIHNWELRNPLERLAERRAAERERKRKYREKIRFMSQDVPRDKRDSPVVSQDVPRDKRDSPTMSRRVPSCPDREEKRREEKRREEEEEEADVVAATPRERPPAAAAAAAERIGMDWPATAESLSNLAVSWGWTALAPKHWPLAIRLAPYAEGEVAWAKGVVNKRAAEDGRQRGNLGLLLRVIEDGRNADPWEASPSKPKPEVDGEAWDSPIWHMRQILAERRAKETGGNDESENR